MPKMIGLINDDKSAINKKFLESELNNKVPITRKINGQPLDKDIEIVGARGTGILKVTTAPASYTTAIGEYTPKYRIALSTVTSQSGVSEVLLGDVIQYSYYQYHVSYLDSTYAYISATRTSLQGATGAAGADGYTPVKGTDYWIPADQESMVQQVLVALGKPVVGEIDANNNIVLIGTLASGTYYLKYEFADGELVDVGQIEIGGAAYTNQLPVSTDASGAIYNGKGWKENTRLGSSGADSSETGFGATGFIPCGNTADIRVKSNVAVTSTSANQSICLYDPNKTFIKRLNWSAITSSNKLIVNADGSILFKFTASYWSDFSGKTVGFCRLAFPGINDNAIVTINEEIV